LSFAREVVRKVWRFGGAAGAGAGGFGVVGGGEMT